jgi:hypothetical protein
MQTTHNQELDLSKHLRQGANEVTIVHSASLIDFVFAVRFHPSSKHSWDTFTDGMQRPVTVLPVVSCNDFHDLFSGLPFLKPI